MAPSPSRRPEGHGPPEPPPDERAESGLHIDVEKQRQTDTWTVLIGVRAVNAILMATFFQPDEFFQALEPAWEIAFGPGSGAWITWEWQHKLRSSLHPYFYAGIFKGISEFTKLAGLPPTLRAQLIWLMPRGVQAGLAALTDYFTWQLAERMFGPNSYESSAVLALTAFSPWNWFVSTRTFSNSFETTLTAVALFYWPWNWVMTSTADPSRKKDVSNLKYFFVVAGLACILRPTNILIWAVLAVFTVPFATQSEFIALVRDASIWGSLVLGVAQYADKRYYGEWVFAPARWINFNLNQNLAIHYGSSRLDYYFTEGLPLLLTTALPFALIGLVQALLGKVRRDKDAVPGNPSYALQTLAAAALATPVVLSAISHKEVRFLYPILPILLVLAAQPFAAFFHPLPFPKSNFKTVLLVGLALINIAIAFYTFYIHNRAVIDVITYLRRQFEASNPSIVLDLVDPDNLSRLNVITVGFLMPCHSTPWRSAFVYKGIDAWALTCEPPIDVPALDRATYLDEADQFYASPSTWLDMHMPPIPTAANAPEVNGTKTDSLTPLGSPKTWPQYLVFYQQLEPTIRSYLKDSRYTGCWRSFNTHWHDDWRRQGDVVVYCKDLYPQPDIEEGKADYRENRWNPYHDL